MSPRSKDQLGKCGDVEHGELQCTRPETTANEDQGHAFRGFKGDREREETELSDLECLHLWGPWQSWNMTSSSLIRQELQRNQLTQSHTIK